MTRRISELRNLGPASERLLATVGIVTADDLARVGSVEAYCRVREVHAHASRNLLWALEGALLDLDWRHLSERHRDELLQAATRRLGQRTA